MFERITAGVSRIGKPELPPEVEDSEDHRAAVKFMEDLQPQDSVSYGWVIGYAKSLWEDRNKTFASIDEKADSIIKYLGGGAGIFALLALAKVDTSNAYLLMWAIPALLCAIVSLFLAAWARRPNVVPNLPSVESAVGYAQEGKKEDDAQAIFLGQWNLACEDMRLVIDMKSARLYCATLFYCAALALLILPLAAAWFHPPSAAAPTAAEHRPVHVDVKVSE